MNDTDSLSSDCEKVVGLAREVKAILIKKAETLSINALDFASQVFHKVK